MYREKFIYTYNKLSHIRNIISKWWLSSIYFRS